MMLWEVVGRGLEASLDIIESLSQIGFRGAVPPANFRQSPMGRNWSTPRCGCMTEEKSQSGACAPTLPPPCWAPLSLGVLESFVCSGAAGTVRLRITNCGSTARVLRVETVGKAQIRIEPPTITLQPMERGAVGVTVFVPPDAGPGQDIEVLVWVRGCRDHYLRWILRVTQWPATGCHEIEVQDCPDTTHHWFDHFYCDRSCPHQR